MIQAELPILLGARIRKRQMGWKPGQQCAYLKGHASSPPAPLATGTYPLEAKLKAALELAASEGDLTRVPEDAKFDINCVYPRNGVKFIRAHHESSMRVLDPSIHLKSDAELRKQLAVVSRQTTDEVVVVEFGFSYDIRDVAAGAKRTVLTEAEINDPAFASDFLFVRRMKPPTDTLSRTFKAASPRTAPSEQYAVLDLSDVKGREWAFPIIRGDTIEMDHTAKYFALKHGLLLYRWKWAPPLA